jgi:hypothetical protein
MFVRTRDGSHAQIKTYRDGGKVRSTQRPVPPPSLGSANFRYWLKTLVSGSRQNGPQCPDNGPSSRIR